MLSAYRARDGAPLSFIDQSLKACHWLYRVVREFWQVQPRVTVIVVSATVLARFTSLAAFLLPLKVLLLAGSEGVPQYFTIMSSAADKPFWITVLSIAAAACYLATRALRTLSEKLYEAGSAEILKQANQLALFGNQASIARRHFKDITNLCADLIFLLIAFAALAVITPYVALGIALLFTLQYGFTAVTLSRSASQFAIHIREKPRDYLQELQTINFWSAFLFLLIPFLIGRGGNILVVILAFVLVRQTLNSCVRAIESIASLTDEKHLIDALVFASYRWQPDYSRTQNFRKLFQKDVHLARIESVLGGQSFECFRTTLRWKDSPIDGVSTFILRHSSDLKSTHYQEQVFAPYRVHLVENEKILFAHVGRDALSAPEVYQSFNHGPFLCRLCDYGSGEPLSTATWNRHLPELLAQHWSVEPPSRLVHAFGTSHAYLHERLTAEFLSGLELAVNGENDLLTLRALQGELAAVCTALSEIPLYVANRDMFPSNTALRSDGKLLVMMWGRWKLEPLGFYLPTTLDKAELAEILNQVRQRRTGVPETINTNHLLLADACRKLEARITEANYEAALRVLPEILNNPVIGTETEDTQSRIAMRQLETTSAEASSFVEEYRSFSPSREPMALTKSDSDHQFW